MTIDLLKGTVTPTNFESKDTSKVIARYKKELSTQIESIGVPAHEILSATMKIIFEKDNSETQIKCFSCQTIINLTDGRSFSSSAGWELISPSLEKKR